MATYSTAQSQAVREPDFSTLLLPVQQKSMFQENGYYVWCGSMIRTADGVCHLFYSRWPKSKGFNGWATDSEIAHATAEQPLGPYTFKNVVLAKRHKKYWDADVTHNPTVLKFGNKYYLYYMGNYGDGTFWDHRNHQRIGVAVAKSLDGPWKRFDKPVVDTTADSWDHLMTSNPSVTQRADGKYLIVYKGVSAGEMPRGGKVSHGAAISDSPTGPFLKRPGTIFDYPGSRFAAEDPFIWRQDGRYFAIVKDMKGDFTKAGTSLALFTSEDGFSWRLTSHPLVSGLTLEWEGGAREKVRRLERPQLWLDKGRPAVLFVAIKRSDSVTCNVAIPLKNVNQNK
ncbi:sucrase [Chitinophaga barathri]|uniref:Sucrase n=2 Tax=Chitinophaga barathri TaxID=1647451 RepID=A0A3N4MMS4_9BACT|nr:sucrase [Chitinophaga barathri]